VTIAVNGSGLIAETDHDATLVPWAELEAGRWYDVYVAVDAGDRTARIRVEGAGPRARASLPIAAGAVLEVSGVELRTEAPRERGVAIYLDDLTVVGGVLEPADALWSEARGPRPTSGGGVPPEAEPRDGPVALHEDFEALAPGSISGTPGWRAIRGSVAVVDSPRSAPVHESAAAASGTDAPAGGEFDEPMGIAVDPEGNFYVTERLGNRVQKFARDGTYLTQWGGRGDGPGQFNEPLDAVADDECLYVVDSWNHRVQAFDWDGGHRFDIRGDDPPLYGPRGIDARHGKIFLVDSGHGMVRVFDRAGQQLTTMGENGGDAPGHLSQPVDVAVGAAGRVYVVNSGNNRVEIFGPDGGVAGSFPISGWEGTDLKEGYLATDADGLIYLSDPVSGRVRRFTTDGVELTALPDIVDLPAGLEADEQHLIVGERLANRVRVIDIPSR
jgi:DNA-binding beta-propeller fold protein YncE